MKKFYFSCLLVIGFQILNAQNVGIGTSTPDASARLDITDTQRGILIPRVALTATNVAAPVTGPANSLLVFNTATDGSGATAVTPGYYYWDASLSQWVRLLTNQSDDWKLDGNSNGTLRYIGTNDNFDFPFYTNGTEKMRITSAGNVGINTTTPTADYLLTINPNTNARRSGINIPMSGASSTAFAINVSTANSNARGYYYENSSNANGVFFGTGSVLTSTNIVSGFTAYRTSSGNSYGLYGITGTNSAYNSTNANTWAAFIQGRAVISSESAPTSPLGVDLEIRNTSTGAGNPAVLSMRQTTANTATNSVLANINFGDNNTTNAQASISVIRDAASSGATDLPTAITFSTTPDASNTLTERMRITNAGNVGIGITAPAATAILDVSSTNRGIRIPNVALTARNNNAPIGAGIVNSLLVYNTATAGTGVNQVFPGYYYWNSATNTWMRLFDGIRGGWDLAGNTLTGTLPSTPNEFIGTTNNADFIIRTNNVERARILASNGNIGINLNNPTGRIHIYDGTRGNLKLLSTNNTGHDFGYDGGGDSQFWFAHMGAATGNTSFLWHDGVNPARFLMYIGNNGYVGIGTTTPGRPLMVQGNVANAHTAGFTNNAGYGVFLGSVNNTNQGSLIAWGGGSYANLAIQYIGGTNQGFTGFGTLTPLAPVDIRKIVGHAAGNGGPSHAPTTAIITGGSTALQNDWPNGWGGGLSTWDICGASTFMNNYIIRSDATFKTQITSITSNPDFIQKFMQLNPVTYRFKRENIQANEWDYNRLHYGFIANEVEKLFPDIVVNAGTDASIKRGIEYDAFIPMLVKMVQEQQKNIDHLIKENQTLKTELEHLKKELSK